MDLVSPHPGSPSHGAPRQPPHLPTLSFRCPPKISLTLSLARPDLSTPPPPVHLDLLLQARDLSLHASELLGSGSYLGSGVALRQALGLQLLRQGEGLAQRIGLRCEGQREEERVWQKCVHV